MRYECTRTGRLLRFGGLVSLFPIVAAFAIIIVLNWDIDVKAYLIDCAKGLPEEKRPQRCECCQSGRKPHRHGKFMRWLYTLDEVLPIPVFRFLCPDCRKSFCVLPRFVEAHHQSAVEVKEQVIHEIAEGRSLQDASEASRAYAGGHYAEKTLWRWLKCWQERLEVHEAQLWNTMIRSGYDAPLPRERHSRWRALFAAWAALERTDSLLHALLRLDRSAILSTVRQNPTMSGHG